MRKLFCGTLINSVSIYIAALVFSSIKIEEVYYLLLAGLVLTLVNLLIRPLLIILALPFNVITLGLFTLVINTWMVMLTDWFITGIHIPGFWVSLTVAVLIILFKLPLKDKCTDDWKKA